jgi:hypothetical protein
MPQCLTNLDPWVLGRVNCPNQVRIADADATWPDPYCGTILSVPFALRGIDIVLSSHQRSVCICELSEERSRDVAKTRKQDLPQPLCSKKSNSHSEKRECNDSGIYHLALSDVIERTCKLCMGEIVKNRYHCAGYCRSFTHSTCHQYFHTTEARS